MKGEKNKKGKTDKMEEDMERFEEPVCDGLLCFALCLRDESRSSSNGGCSANRFELK